jgi:hypothetical protein
MIHQKKKSWDVCNPSYLAHRGQDVRPAQQKISKKWAGGVAQAVAHLTNKCKALTSNPSTPNPPKK